MSFIPLKNVIGLLTFFVSLLLMVWGGLRFTVVVTTIYLRVAIILRY